MESEYRLLKQKGGRPHFARVTVDTKLKSRGINIIEAIREPIDIGECEINRKNGSDWIDAVILGAKTCAESLITEGKISGCQVKIRRVVGTILDTTEEDLFCAGALATWQSLNEGKELPSFYFEDNKWHIEF